MRCRENRTATRLAWHLRFGRVAFAVAIQPACLDPQVVVYRNTLAPAGARPAQRLFSGSAALAERLLRGYRLALPEYPRLQRLKQLRRGIV